MTIFRKRTRKIFVTFIWSYLIVLIIPIALESITYVKASHVLEGEVNDSNITMLDQIRDGVDTKLTEVEHMMSEISLNYDVRKFLSVTNPMRNDNRYLAFNIIRDFQPYNGNNTFIKDFYIYFKNSDYIITSNSTYTPELFYKYLYSYKGVPFEKWYEGMRNLKFDYMNIKAADMIINSNPQQILTYTQTLSFSETEEPTGLLTVLMDENAIKQILKDAAKGGYAYITDKNGNIIVNTGDSTSYLPVDKLNGDMGLGEHQLDGRDMVVAYVKSQKTQWTYVSVIPRTIFMQKLDYLKNTAIYIIVICFVLGLLIAYLLASRNYSPIRHILEALVPLKGDIPHKGINEYDYIRDSVISAFKKNVQLETKMKDIIKQNERINGMINKNGDMVKNSLLISLLKGRVNDFDSILSWLTFYNITFPYRNFNVIIFHIDDCSRFISEDSEKDWNLIRFVITSVAEELANENNSGYTMELEQDTIALILNISDNVKPVQAKAVVNQMSNKLKDFVSTHFNTVLTIGIGSLQSGISNINVSYKQAEKALDYKLVRGTSSVINCDEIVDEDKEYYYPVDSELRLINFIKAGDFGNCDRILQQIFDENFNKRKLQLKLIKCLYFDIMSTAIKVLDAISLNYSDIFDFDPVGKLTSCETIDEMHKEILDIFESICEYINNTRKGHSAELKEQIIKYINEHYTDDDLSQTMIADHFNISAPYLSKYFKKELGDNMVDYINRLKVDGVKALLTNSELPLSEIAQKTGYTSSKTLIRVFKQYEGVTPGQYRSSL